MPGDLSRVFLEHASGAATAGQPPGLEQALRDLWQAARQAWPGIDLPVTDFVAHLARHAPKEGDSARFLAGVQAPDLYLACACLKGLPAALQAFDRSFLSQVPAALSRLKPDPAFVDEVRQRLREKLFVAAEAGGAKLGAYAGNGPLHHWLRAVALREALNLRRTRSYAGTPTDDRALDALAAGGDPETDYLQARHGQELREAMKAAFAGLQQEQRNVLRLHYAGGLGQERIAALLRLSRATVVRRLASARAAMLQETRRQLQQRLRLPASELDSLVAALRSRLDLSITSLLRSDPG